MTVRTEKTAQSRSGTSRCRPPLQIPDSHITYQPFCKRRYLTDTFTKARRVRPIQWLTPQLIGIYIYFVNDSFIKHCKSALYYCVHTNLKVSRPGAGIFSVWRGNFSSILLICDLGSVSSQLRTFPGSEKHTRGPVAPSSYSVLVTRATI